MSTYELMQSASIESEVAVLGGCMMYDNVLQYCMLNVNAHMFATEFHQDTFIAIRSIYEKNSKPDAISVVRELKSLGKNASAYEIAKMTDKATTIDIDGKVDYIKQCYARRNIFETAKYIQDASFDETIGLDQIISLATSFEDDLLETFTGNGDKGIEAQVDDAMDVIKDKVDKASRGEIVGMPTQLHGLNNIISGIEKGQMIVIAARPGDGKTSFMLDLAMSQSDQGLYPALFSLEMSDCQLIHRLMLADSGVDYIKFQSGKLNPIDMQHLEASANKIRKSRLYVDDKPTVNIPYIKSMITRLKRKGKCDIVFIDYLQLMEGGSGKDRQEKVASMSRALKLMTQELDVPIVALSQLNRGAAGSRPRLDNLRESGAIEQDANKVMFLFRPYKNGIYEDDNGGLYNDYDVEIIVEKNREGPTGKTVAYTNKTRSKYFDHDSGRIVEADININRYEGKEKILDIFSDSEKDT